MTVLYLCLGLLLPVSSFAWDIARTPRDGAPKPRPKRQYEAPHHEPGETLPKRPEGMASLKAEIALTPPGRHRAPELKPIKAHPDWAWNTTEFEVAWDDFFAGQPVDQAVVYEWAGAGLVA